MIPLEIIDVDEFCLVENFLIINPTNLINSTLAPKWVNKFQLLQLLCIEFIGNPSKVIREICILKQKALLGNFT